MQAAPAPDEAEATFTWQAGCCCTQCGHHWERESDEPPGTMLQVACPLCRAASLEVLAVTSKGRTKETPDGAPSSKP